MTTKNGICSLYLYHARLVVLVNADGINDIRHTFPNLREMIVRKCQDDEEEYWYLSIISIDIRLENWR